MNRWDVRFRHYGSGWFLIRSVLSALLLVVAGAAVHFGFTHGGVWTILGCLVIAIILVFAGIVVNAGMGLRVHQRNTPLGRTTQLLLEEYWTRCFNALVENGRWPRDLHLRFVVYIPLRLGFIGPSYLIAMHFLDRDETRNSDEYVIDVRTRAGWAGKVFATGKTMVADLERSAELIKLHLTERQIQFVHDLGLKSKICVPLMEGPNNIVGVFSVESRDGLHKSKFQNPEVAAMIETVAKVVFTTCDTAYNLRRHRVRGNAHHIPGEGPHPPIEGA